MSDAGTLAGRLKGPAHESLLRDWKTVGIDVGKTTAPQLVKLIREEPLRFTQALKLAQTAAGQPPHAWFMAFAPSDAPKIAVAVLVENGGNLGSEATGGKLSAPIAQQVMVADRQVRGW